MTYDVTDSSGNAATQVIRTVNVVDTTPPAIALLGSTPVDVEVGSVYTDAGATASDNVDGDLTGSIVTANPVNTAVLGPYLVTYDVTDNAGNAATQVTRTVNVVDTTPPVITLLGSSPLIVEVGGVYTEAGATASDNFDGDLSASIVTVATAVNTAVVGSYPVTYNVSDEAGNAATQVTRTVNVVDTTPPVITLLGSSPLIVEVGGVYTEAGATASDNFDGDLSASIVTVATAVNTAVVGSYPVTYNVSDEAGNAATQVTRTVNVVDTTPPVITLLGSSPLIVEVGGVYTEAGATASDNFDGDLSASIVIVATAVNTAVVGSYPVTYNVSDEAGNAATQVTRTVKVVDTTPPVITLLGSSPLIVEVGSVYTDAGATASDNVDGDLTGSIVTANPVNTAVLGPYLVTYDVTDNAGNSATQVTRTVNVVDTTPPVITLLGSSPLDVEVGSVYTDAGATASDNVDGDLTGSIVTANPVNTAVLGPYLVTYDVTDNAGNSATQVTRTVNVVDTTPPVISATVSPGNASGWNNTDVTVSWSVEDPESGIASSVGCETTVLSAETTGTQLTCTATNGVDLSEFSVSRTISIDLTAPTASAAATPGPNANGWNNTAVTVNINGTDSLSGIDSCTAPVSLSTEGAGQSGSGTCTDLAGNVSAAAMASGIKIDLTAPTLTFGAASPAANAAGWNNTDVSVPFTAADVLSGVDITSPAVSPLVLSAEGSAVTGTVTVADLAGNNAVLTSPAVKIDKTPPLVSASSTPGPNANGWNNTDVTVNFAAVDGLSGVGPFSDPVTVTTEGAGQLISGTATDLAGNLGGASVTLSIDKTAPIVSDVMGTPNPVEIDISSEVTATVSNPTQAGAPIVAADFQIEGGAFTAMAAVDGFGDLTESVTSAPVLPSFSPASVQTICVQGTDAADNVSDLECTLLVVFDPSGGFVTGSGFINSPSGAYTPNDPLDEDFTGKANFGFVSKYKKGATTPIGETEFRFKVADLNFHSTSYDWLVVAGAKAQFKGDGTVNGQFGSNNTSGYGFLLTATDGQQPGGLGTDKFRIKIVDKFTDTVLYDNVAGESEDIDDAMPTTVAGGSIVIHKKAVK